ncbi:hypothetical protein B0H67DRAFT_602127 [Lasiosphaeris hirsuta]|uniref:Uncharacterized protein n=1 Tax=Lasiosphaeris hirsuta TaxID=260670 RepID=A0AA40A8N8_9PEZI|nr:hypothetical protein B0H67DRAFT_602127 [Lasiosphaeris hirsuta]
MAFWAMTPPQLSTSVPALRFPRPQGSQQLANWISNSSPDIRQPPIMSDTGSLADSAYEIINGTDSESQDGLLSESIGSLEVHHPDDVHSLDGSETRYDSDTDDESDQSSRASSIRYADQILQNPSTQVPANSLRYGSTSSTEGSGVILGSIEFQEGSDGETVNLDNISVKHAVRECTDEETAAVVKQLNMSDAPNRLVATIRQTMSPAYLSTTEPLRVLYVGFPEAKRSIVLKVSNAIWASPKQGVRDEDTFGRHREGVFNIVPISSFGPTPELDLMEASQYQIKVEHCTSASEFHGSTMYSITIGEDISNLKTYSTILSPEGSFMKPNWTLPHIAIFYCADDDDERDGQTREAAWKFMKTHEVPCIFISEFEVIGKPMADRWGKYVDERAVHLCLESRDSERPIPPQRFPIDLSSFLNIDTRQMNRNLAYLTGLAESPEKPGILEHVPPSTPMRANLRKAWSRRPSRQQVLESVEQNKWFVAMLIPIVMALLAPSISALFTSMGGVSPIQQAPLSDFLGMSSPTCVGRLSTSTGPAATSTTTVVINVTSTKTVQMSHAQPSTSTLASALSFAGFLSDKPSSVPIDPEVKKTVCSVRVYSPNEVLVTIPSRSKASWLAKGAIDIDVFRGEQPIRTKISSVDQGIIVEMTQRDAYGTLNVSVVTTRKPKINETFEVDFGKAVVVEAFEAGMNILQDLAKKVYSTVDEAVNVVEDVPVAAGVTKLQNEAASALEHAFEAGKNQYEEAVNRGAKEMMSHHLKSARRVRVEVDMSILQAQITSKLLWLKLQGKKEEVAEYKRNASLFLKMKYAEIIEAYEEQEKLKSSSKDGYTKDGYSVFGKRSHRAGKKHAQSSDTNDRRWKKMIIG